MKNNKIVILIIATVLIIVVAIGMVIFYTKKNEKTDNELNLKFKEVANLKKISTELPDFEIEIDGAYVGILDKNLLLSNDIEVYEFDAGIDNGWDIVTNHYIGVKLSDVYCLGKSQKRCTKRSTRKIMFCDKYKGQKLAQERAKPRWKSS